MEADFHDEIELFRAVTVSHARALLIGRRALVVYGLPVLTADYDYWIHIDDIEAFNAALTSLDMQPTRAPKEARASGRYVIENGDHVDVVVARSAKTVDGDVVSFDDVWSRRVVVPYDADVSIAVPTVDDLIRTKRWTSRPRDVADVEMLKAIRRDKP